MQEHRVYYLFFHTIHDVLKADKVLKKKGARYELVPVPRNLSSDCGMCIKLDDNLQEIKDHLGAIEMDKCFLFDGKTYVHLT